MCEPAHSIVQFPDKDDDDNPTETKIDAIQPPDDCDKGFWQRLKARVRSWFHFSLLGAGHYEAIGRLSPTAWGMLPAPTKYEADWAERNVKLDGQFFGPAWDQKFALEAATEYAGKVSIGNLTALRNFLETSMRKSARPFRYAEEFMRALTSRGRDAFNGKLVRLGLKDSSTPFFNPEIVRGKLDALIAVTLGFTRKRNLLIPAWADDGKLWRADR